MDTNTRYEFAKKMIYNYKWEIELTDKTIITKGNDFNFDDVVRLSYIPNRLLLPRHDLVFTDFKLKKRFCRGMMGWNGIMKEYLHCVITDKFRFYLKSSNGQVLITEKHYDYYI